MATSEHPDLVTEDSVVRGAHLQYFLEPKTNPNYNLCKSQACLLEHEKWRAWALVECLPNKNNSKEYTEMQPVSFWQASTKHNFWRVIRRKSPRVLLRKAFDWTTRYKRQPTRWCYLLQPSTSGFLVGQERLYHQFVSLARQVTRLLLHCKDLSGVFITVEITCKRLKGGHTVHISCSHHC